jgi:hypothetical protein
MGTGQTMITLFAMILLSTVILTINRGFLTTNTTMNNNRVDVLALSVGNSIMEDAIGLAFDEKTVGAAVTSTSSLTASASLGLEGSESATNPAAFDDFDDYNCYASSPKLDTVAVPGTINKYYFSTYCSVKYVDGSNPNTVSSSPTYHKRISLRVFSPKMDDTVRLSTIYSYWYFR